MTLEARLAEAMADAGAPARDPAFVLAVIEEAERERFRTASLLSVLRGGGVAAAAAALAGPFLSWSAANAEALQTGLIMTTGLLVLVSAIRYMTARTAAWGG